MKFPKYGVSNLGRVMNIHTNKVLHPGNDKDGYKLVTLFNGTVISKRTRRVHRLVGEEFLPNPDNKPQINHKDFNKANNSSNNLEWVTLSENARHSNPIVVIICSKCGLEEIHLAKGFCSKCYFRDYQQRNRHRIKTYHKQYYQKKRLMK